MLGYTMAGLLGFRLIYGLAGPRQARLGATWRKAAALPDWLRTMRAGGWTAVATWRQAQHLATAVAVLALLAAAVPLTASGTVVWQDWTGEWLAEVHEFLAEAMLMIVFAHVGTIAGVSLLRRRNQALPMLTGRTDGAGPDLVKSDRRWLAALMLVAVLGFGAWSMAQGPETDDAPAAQRAGHGG
jgi:cytochrome b